MVFTTNNNLSAPQFMDFTVNTKFLPILVFTDFTINDNLLPLKFMESPNNTNKFTQELMVPTLCLLSVLWVSVKPRLNLRLKLNTTGLNTMVNTTVPLPAPTLSPVILMLQLTLLDTPPPTPPLILLDIPASTTPLLLDIPPPTTLLILDILPPSTPLILDIPQSTRLPSTTKLKFKHKGWLRKRNKSLGKQPQLKNRLFFPKELQLPKENTRSYVHSCQINNLSSKTDYFSQKNFSYQKKKLDRMFIL